TSMSWHGILQMNSGNMDGTNGVIECLIPLGGQRTYTFLLTQLVSLSLLRAIRQWSSQPHRYCRPSDFKLRSRSRSHAYQ
ncbi:uncharacterized protein LY89DRAFT_599216, partial [Mollisia scopiformis]